MDEFNAILHKLEETEATPPREVVLRYESPQPQPVEERYVSPEPLPGHRAAATVEEQPRVTDAQRYTFKPRVRTPKRSRKGLHIFLGCCAAMLLTLAFLSIRALHDNAIRKKEAQSPPIYRYETERQLDLSEYSDLETTIERYPIGSGIRLRYAESHGEELTIQQVYERVNPSTVTVATAMPGGSAIIGAGVIFTADGYIVTNAHVITGGTECYVVLDNQRSYPAQLIGYDVRQDLAVIKVDAENLPVAEFGDSDILTVGDTVYAIGNPLGVQLRGTLTDGIVSAINRDVLVDGVKMTLIQTNAALNNGNSGGPLINVYGQVVGINTMKMGSSNAVSVEGLGFAIPVSSAAWMIDNLIEYGEVRGEPVLGISVLREAVTLNTGETALQIYEIEPYSGAADAGITMGDCIVYADGEEMHSVNDLLRARRRYSAGEKVLLEIDRHGQRLTLDVTLKEMS